MNGLTILVGSEAVPLTKCSWYFMATCGCTYGVMTADTHFVGMPGGHVYVTEDQAWEHFEPNRTMRARLREAGERAELGLSADVRERVVLDCPHIPQWGRETTPVPTGHTWASTDRSPKTKHLVVGKPLAEGERRPWLEPMGEERPTLCRRTKHKYWRAVPYLLSELPECLPCVAKAKDWHETHVAAAPLMAGGPS